MDFRLDPVFWGLWLLACACFVPWFMRERASRGQGVLWALLLLFVSYGLYVKWGAARHLNEYYSAAQQSFRVKQKELQALLIEFQKIEFRLRLRLEQYPNDIEAKQRLFDLLAIKQQFSQ